MSTAKPILNPPSALSRGLLYLAIGLCAVICRPSIPAPLAPAFGPASLTLRASNDVALYYLLERSTNLPAFAPWSMKLGHGGPEWSVRYDAGPDAAFFRARWFSLYGPGDLDGDGLDDVWELDHPDVLNPLDPADARRVNPVTGLTYLQEYERIYGRRVPKNEAISRELSLFNFESPLARFEAISREVSVRTYPPEIIRPEAISREVSFYNGERPPNPLFPDVISREVSVRTHPPEDIRPEAISHEVSLYNGERPPDPLFPDVTSREVSLFNFESPLTRYEAISRELSLYNGERPAEGE